MCECKHECQTDHVAELCSDRAIDGQLNQDIDSILDEIAQGRHQGVICNEGLGRLVTGIEMARDEIKNLEHRLNALSDALSVIAGVLVDEPDGELQREAG